MRSALYLLLLMLSTNSWSGGVHVAAGALQTSLLSIPEKDSNETERQSEIQAVALQISNQPRFQVVNGALFPLPPGPLPVNGSLAQQIVFQELQLVTALSNPNISSIAGAAAAANITSLDDYLKFYQSIEQLGLIATPLTALDFSDAAFGEDRLTIKGFRLRQVTTTVKTSIPLTPAQLDKLCGARSLKDLIQQKRLYVEDYSFAAFYNDKSRPHKYVPSIKGYFCVNQKKQFLPMAIHILDTKLVYTPYDKADEWKLAKIALNAAGLNVQPWDHFVNAHIMLEPIRVELLRTMSSRHPVHALMEHHFLQLFGNELLALQVLLSANTTVDFTFGWGATGSLRYVYDESRTFHFKEKFFINQIKANGLDNIPNAKLFADSRNVFHAVRCFVRDFVRLYYGHRRDEDEHHHVRKGHHAHGTNAAIVGDSELQSWLLASSKVVPGFPSKATTMKDLVDTLSNLIFRTSVLHHAMNSDVVWHTLSFPYSLPGLFAPLPTTKGQTNITLRDFVTPRALFAPAIGLFAAFVRPITPAISILHSYDSLAFNTTAHDAIAKYEAKLQDIEADIVSREKNNPRPDTFLKPSRLPHYVWV